MSLPHDFKILQYQVEKIRQYVQFKFHPKNPPLKEELEYFEALENSNIYS